MRAVLGSYTLACEVCSAYKNMSGPFRNVVPTPYLQGSFCGECYKGTSELDDVLSANGFELQRTGESEESFHMYIPQSLPTRRGVGRSGYDWARVPKEVPVGFIFKATDVATGMEVAGAGDQAVQSVQVNCSRILRRLNGFVEDYPQLKKNGNRIKVYLTAHSLAGFMAAATTVSLKDWADRTGSELVCTTFESPGISKYYLDIAHAQMTGDEWKNTICNYVAVPNIINMAYKHLGRIVFMDCSNDVTNVVWMARCVIRSVVCRARAAEDTESSSLMGLLTAYIGVEILWGAQQHSLSNMLETFQRGSGLPRAALAHGMESWPSYTSLKEFLEHNLSNVFELLGESDADSIGVHTMLNREAVMWRRLQTIEGFVPARRTQDLCYPSEPGRIEFLMGSQENFD